MEVDFVASRAQLWRYYWTSRDRITSSRFEPRGDVTACDDREQLLVGDVPQGRPGEQEPGGRFHSWRRLGQVGLMKGGGLMMNECDCIGGSHC